MGKYELIKKAAEAKGYSINRLEKELGFPKGSISKYDTNTPSVDKIIAIANFLDVSIDSISQEENYIIDSYKRYTRLLEENGVSSEFVKKRLGLPSGIFYEWECGLSQPDLKIIGKIASFFDVTAEWICYGSNDLRIDPDDVMKNKHEKNIIAMYRNAGDLSDEEASEFEDMFASTLDIYLKARGIKKK